MAKVKLTFHRGGRSGSYRVTIPKSIVDSLEWCDGLELDVKITDYEGKRGIVLVPADDPKRICKRNKEKQKARRDKKKKNEGGAKDER